MTTLGLRLGAVTVAALVAAGAAGCEGVSRLPRPPSIGDPPPADAGRDDRTPIGDGGVTPVSLTRVEPSHGPFDGGNEALLRGAGFREGLEVSFGGTDLLPEEIRVVDDNRVEVIVPAGMPGPVEVTVRVGDDVFTRAGAYVYDAVHVDPSSGSTAGGTRIELTSVVGFDFLADLAVTIGGTACRDVEVLSARRARCLTAASAPAVVDVVVATGGESLLLEDGYEYLDTSDFTNGGFGGGPLDGNLDVSVFDSFAGIPIPGVHVIVEGEGHPPIIGTTGPLGNVTLGSDDLVGPQTLHLSLKCFEKVTFVAFDAAQVTAFMRPWIDLRCIEEIDPQIPPTGGATASPAIVEGVLKFRGPNELGANPWDIVPPARPGEERVAYVFATASCATCLNPTPSGTGTIHRVRELGPIENSGYPYRIRARRGVLAVYALVGVENLATDEFVPYAMGITRSLFLGPDEQATRDILVDIPLDHVVEVSLDELPERATAGPDRFLVRAVIDLGGEGFVRPDLAEDGAIVARRFDASAPFRLFGQPALRGAIEDSRYVIQARWVTGEGDDPPSTESLRSGVRVIGDVVTVTGFVGVPEMITPIEGGLLPSDRTLRWRYSAGGAPADLQTIALEGNDGNPAWRIFAPSDRFEVHLPDFSVFDGDEDLRHGEVRGTITGARITGFSYEAFTYRFTSTAIRSAWATANFAFQR